MCLYKEDYLKSGQESSNRNDTGHVNEMFGDPWVRWNGEFETDGLG